jgi:type VI secretion system protein VasD
MNRNQNGTGRESEDGEIWVALFYFVIFICLIALTGCASTGTASVTLVAADNINPSSVNSASPVVVKIFQLKDDEAFKRADFFGLYLHPKETLGDDYLTENEVMIAPGQTKEIKLNLNNNAHYLSVLVAYQNLDQAKWNDSKKISTFFGRTSLDIKLDHDDVSLD